MTTEQLPFETIVIRSELGEAKKPEEVILRKAEACGFSSESMFAIKLTIEEGLTNAIKHGNKQDPGKTVTVRYFVDTEQVVVSIKDQGAGFDPDDVPDPRSEDRLALPNGRGILLMRAYMTQVEYRQNGTEVFMRKLNQ
jgi:serine/threonine-protein kinase RsbW